MSGEPQIRASIIVVSYNALDKLVPCLRSVLSHLSSDCELIVIDNASSEGNADAIAAQFPEVKLVRSPVNLGFGPGANRAAVRARGHYLAFLNPDTLVEPEWVERMIDGLERETRAGLATPKIVMAGAPEKINTCGCDVHLSGLALCRGLLQPASGYSRTARVGSISGAAFVIRRELFELLGGFDEDMFLYVEDIDLSWRARLGGWETIYVPESVVRHDYEFKLSRQKIFWQERNRYLMLLKSLRWPTLIAISPALLLTEIVSWGFVLLRDRKNAGNKPRAYLWVVRHWARIMRGRKDTREVRAVSDRDMLKATTFALDFQQGGGGQAGAFAGYIFNPLFFLLRSVALAVVWW
jgi:GT2 family glycosyltransferase